MTKQKQKELQLTAINLWFKTYGYPGMSSDEEREYMSSLIVKLNKTTKTKTK